MSKNIHKIYSGQLAMNYQKMSDLEIKTYLFVY